MKMDGGWSAARQWLSLGLCTALTGAACAGCSAGEYCEGGALGGTCYLWGCTACAIGQYCDDQDGCTSGCHECDSGQSTFVEGQQSCFKCPAGREWSFGECSACDVGQYQPDEGTTQCIDCGPGQFSTTIGSDSDGLCVSCSSGQYSESSGQHCTTCTAGKYAQAAGVSRCTACPTGRYTEAVGSTSIDACGNCPAGQHAGSGHTSCVDCEAGRWCSGGCETCTACSAGKYYTKSSLTSASDCIDCPQGRYASSIASSCTKCVVGKYLDAVGSASESSCKDCGHQTTPAGASSCDGCPDGQHLSDSDCTDCAAGKFRQQGDSGAACRNCAAGQYSNDGAARCSDCRPGQYAKEEGTAQCTRFSCPDGQSSNSPQTGRVNPDGLTCADCPLGKYRKDVTDVSVCDACEAGQFTMSPGNHNPKGCEACYPPSACAPELGRCATGHTGSFCADCAPNYYRLHAYELCKACPELSMAVVVAEVCALLFILGVAGALLVRTLQRSDMDLGAALLNVDADSMESTADALDNIKLWFGQLQRAAMFVHIPSITWPHFLVALATWLRNMISFNIFMATYPPECGIVISAIGKIILRAWAMFWLLPLAALFVWAGMWVANNENVRHACFKAFVIPPTVLLFLPLIASKSFANFNNNTTTEPADGSMSDSDDAVAITATTIASVCVLCACIGGVCFVTIVGRKKLMADQQSRRRDGRMRGGKVLSGEALVQRLISAVEVLHVLLFVMVMKAAYNAVVCTEVVIDAAGTITRVLAANPSIRCSQHDTPGFFGYYHAKFVGIFIILTYGLLGISYQWMASSGESAKIHSLLKTLYVMGITFYFANSKEGGMFSMTSGGSCLLLLTIANTLHICFVIAQSEKFCDEGQRLKTLSATAVELFVCFISIPMLYETDQTSWMTWVLGGMIVAVHIVYPVWLFMVEGKAVRVNGKVLLDENQAFATAYLGGGCISCVFCTVFLICSATAIWRGTFGDGFDVVYDCPPGWSGLRCDVPIICKSLKGAEPTGYMILAEDNLDARMSFAATATCARGYRGTPVVTACLEPNKPYRLTGCTAGECVQPADTTGYASIDENSLRIEGFDVSAKCSDSYDGTAVAKACADDGASYTLTGCSKFTCAAPDNKDDYVVAESVLTIVGFAVTATCKDGPFQGTATVQTCTKDSPTYTLSGCEACREVTAYDKGSIWDSSLFSVSCCDGGRQYLFDLPQDLQDQVDSDYSDSSTLPSGYYLCQELNLDDAKVAKCSTCCDLPAGEKCYPATAAPYMVNTYSSSISPIWWVLLVGFCLCAGWIFRTDFSDM